MSTDPGRGGAWRVLGWMIPPFLAAVLMEPFIIPGGTLRPWSPAMIDLDVYARAAQDLLAGRDFYVTPDGKLPWIYPPFAALLAAPMAVTPITALRLLWIAVNIAVLLAILYRLGLRRWVLPLAATVCVLLVEPVRETLGFGQLGILLVGAAVLDSMPGARATDALDKRRRLPEGWLVGVATAIKLTPAVVAAYNFFAGRRKPGLVAFATFIVATGLAFLIIPSDSIHYWTMLASGNSGINAGIVFKTNQSVMGVWARLFGELSKGGLLLSGVVAILGLVASVLVHKAGEPRFALVLAGLTSLLASPISWSHHYVWVVPLALVAWYTPELGKALRGFIYAYCAWIVVAPFKSLPGGNGEELHYGVGAQIVDNLGVALGLILLIWSLLWAIRARKAAATTVATLDA